jgi:hypothetical protein
MNKQYAKRLSGLCLGVASLIMLTAANAEPVTYNFDMDVGATSLNGFFVIDGDSSNYVGGGTTTMANLLDYSFTFTQGSSTLVGAPSNLRFMQTFDMTYAADLSKVTTWDFSMGFYGSNGSRGISFAGNNKKDGFVQVADLSQVGVGAYASPAPTLQGDLQVNAVPTPPVLPLVGAGLIGLALARRRGVKSER